MKRNGLFCEASWQIPEPGTAEGRGREEIEAGQSDLMDCFTGSMIVQKLSKANGGPIKEALREELL